jgi:UDP-glucose 4-epimerase
MPYIAQVATGKLPSLKVFGSDYPTKDGTGVRDYIHVMDLAEGHLSALLYLAEHVGWSAINLGTGQGYSVLEMIQAFEVASQKKIEHEFHGRRDGDIAECFAKVNKASEVLGWQAQRELLSMCASSWHFQSRDRFADEGLE